MYETLTRNFGAIPSATSDKLCLLSFVYGFLVDPGPATGIKQAESQRVGSFCDLADVDFAQHAGLALVQENKVRAGGYFPSLFTQTGMRGL